jgi:dihydroneopterin triphosphate diphosphatase
MRIVSELIEAHIFRISKIGIEFLLLKRSTETIYPGIWQMVTGKMNKDEPAYKAALREIMEETGLIPEKLWVAPNVNSFYDHINDTISFLPVFAGKVSLDSKVIISEEHSEYQWASPGNTKKLLAWPGQKKSIDVINEYFKEESSLLNFIEIML